MKYLILIVIFILTSCSNPQSEPSCTFIQNQYNQRVSWYNLPVIIGIDASIPSNLRQAIYDAALDWNNSFGKELIRVVPYSSYNSIYWQTTPRSNINEEANTVVYWYDTSIYQADIYVNAHDFQFYYGNGNGVEFKSLMIHEMGHVLGLNHSSGVMSPYLSQGQVRWNIDQTIISNLTCEY